jgi:hypothetical protein
MKTQDKYKTLDDVVKMIQEQFNHAYHQYMAGSMTGSLIGDQKMEILHDLVDDINTKYETKYKLRKPKNYEIYINLWHPKREC